jgi:hypothetical protein
MPQFSDRGMDPAGIINFRSNEDAQELAPGFFIFFFALLTITNHMFSIVSANPN